METPTIAQHFKAAHIIANENPQACINEVEVFIKDKKDCETVFSTSPIVNRSNLGRVEMVIITTCLITWYCTEEQYREFNNRLKLVK